MADRFGVNSRTLQRTLAEDDTSYRHISERMMFRRAVDLLADESLSVKTISSELSYSSPNSFIRAFRRIAGVTPGAYRQR